LENPLVYGALGTSIYFYIDNNKKIPSIPRRLQSRLEGYTTDDLAFLDNNRLIGQKILPKEIEIYQP
jgi:hypothetical protein